MKRLFALSIVVFAILASLAANAADAPQFEIKTFTANDFYTFTKIFGEMRGPLRSEILKDSKANFENADPLKYVQKVKDTKDVKKALSSAGLGWDQFQELMGNIVLAYFSIQPDKTKAAIIRQMADYGFMPGIPEEYQPAAKELLKTNQGSELAALAMEIAVQVPEGNLTLAKQNQLQLDKFFYTKFWKDKL